jgi:hypothetical protein
MFKWIKLISEFVWPRYSRISLQGVLLRAFWFLSAEHSFQLNETAHLYLRLVYGALGFVASVLVSWGPVYCMARFSPFPVCKRGRCRAFKDYDWLPGTLYGWIDWKTYYNKCNCGDFYIRSRGRFFEVLPDGTQKPYDPKTYDKASE